MGTTSSPSPELESLFPGLTSTTYEITSPVDPKYNCIAWAAGDQSRWWEPDPMGVCYWPQSVPRQRTLSAYRLAFESLGYAECVEATQEKGFTKVALFAKASQPTHASRQLPSSVWSSKLGRHVDISHELQALCGETYGTVAAILKCPSPPAANQPS